MATYRPNVAAILQRPKSGKILIAERLKHPGSWQFPQGGVDPGEDLIGALYREVEEETGFIVESAGLAGVNDNHVDVDDVQYHGIRILYHAHIVGGELRAELDGTTDLCQWWPKRDLNQIDLVDLAQYGVGLAFDD